MIRTLILSIFFFSVLSAGVFQTVPKEKGTFIKKGKQKYFCANCGMHLPSFFKTNHIHKNNQYCSLHCLYEATKKKIPKNAKVVDTKTLKFISVTDAFYVIGSKKPGTMTANSKYAFKNKKDALEFQKENGGKIVDFKTAYNIAAKDFP